MFKKSCPIFLLYSTHKNGLGFLVIKEGFTVNSLLFYKCSKKFTWVRYELILRLVIVKYFEHNIRLWFCFLISDILTKTFKDSWRKSIRKRDYSRPHQTCSVESKANLKYSYNRQTVRPRSLYSFYQVNYCIKWGKTSLTYSR